MIHPLRLLLAAALLPASLYFSGCTPDQLPQLDKIERQLLVVWVALEKDDPATARTAVTAANRKWNDVRTTFASQLLSRQEMEMLELTDVWLLGLRNAVNSDELHRASRPIHQLQQLMMGLRPQYGVDHPLDLLYAFHAQWDWITEISNDQMLCLLEWGEYELAFREARDLWTRYQSTPYTLSGNILPGRLTHSTDTEFAALHLTEMLDAFEEHLGAADRTVMPAAADRVREGFFAYLATAVDYPPRVAAR